MKPHVERIEFLDIARGGGGRLVFDKELQTVERTVIDIARHAADRCDLQRLPHEGRVSDVAHADAGDVGTLLRLNRNEPLFGEAGERFGDRLPRNPETVADLRLIDLGTGLEP
jgi:hypothetical protein